MASQENDSAGAKLIKTPLDSRSGTKKSVRANSSFLNDQLCVRSNWISALSHLHRELLGFEIAFGKRRKWRSSRAVLKGWRMFCVAESERARHHRRASLCFLGFMTPGDEQKMRDLSEVVTLVCFRCCKPTHKHTPMDPCTILLLLLCAFASTAH
jgi:hypothetical protein